MASTRIWTTISHIKANKIIKELEKRSLRRIRKRSEELIDSKDLPMEKVNAWTYFHTVSDDLNSIYDYLQFKWGNKWYNYRIEKSIKRNENYELKDPALVTACATFSRMTKYPKYPQVDMINLGAVHYANPKYMNKELHNCVCYDRNKAYLATCINLELPLYYLGALFRAPKKNEIGFNFNGIPIYGPSKTTCKYIFQKGILEGLNKWAYYNIDRLNNASTPEEKKSIKAEINIAIGNLGNKDRVSSNNKAIRNTIVYTMNQYIEKLKDENTLFSNTDSIVSLVPRKDIKISDKVGDFKIEHEGDFIYINSTKYQWNKGEVNGSNKELQRKWEIDHGRKFDLFRDDPSELFYYKPIHWNEKGLKYEETN